MVAKGRGTRGFRRFMGKAKALPYSGTRWRSRSLLKLAEQGICILQQCLYSGPRHQRGYKKHEGRRGGSVHL